MEDKLILKGVNDQIDGEYPCDVIGMLTIGHPNSLTMREYHQIKVMTGLVAGNLFEAIQSGDLDGVVGLCAVILTRNGKTFQDDWLWAAKADSMGFTIKAAQEEEEVPPQEDAPDSTPISASETSGGVPSDPSSESRENGQSGTGSQPTDTSVISAQEISGI